MSCSRYSCCSCCCVTSSGEQLEGTRKKERLVRWEEEEEEEEAGGGQEESRRNMDISLLREHYRSTRETQRRHTQVLLLRTVSEELSEAVSIIPVTQGLTSPWEPNSASPPAVTFDPDPTTYDPWHIHLGLHRRSCPGVAARLAASPPETTNSISSSRRSSSSSEAFSSQQDVDGTSDPPSSSRETSPCGSTIEEDHVRGDPSCERSRGDPEKVDPAQVSVSASPDAPEQDPSRGSKEDHPDDAAGSLTCSDESSTPVVSVSSSTTSLHEEDLKENQSAGRRSSNGSASAWTGPALSFTRQLSVGGMGSFMGVHQNQNYHPFPNRKTPRISEAARRLGMYSSF